MGMGRVGYGDQNTVPIPFYISHPYTRPRTHNSIMGIPHTRTIWGLRFHIRTRTR